MIKRLRQKFILISFLSVFVLLAAILSTVNIVNYVRVANEADAITLVLAENEGRFPGQNNPRPGEGSEMPGGKETPFDSRYFTVTYRDDSVVSFNLGFIASVDETKAKEMAASAYARKGVGFYDVFRYRVSEKNDGTTIVIFLDYSRQLSPTMTFLWMSLLVGGIGLALVLAALILVSKKVVAPIVKSQEQQKRFVADAAHELKTPLTIISANNEILEIENGENESTTAINHQVERMRQMVQNLTSLARLETEKSKVIFARFDLSGAAKEVASSFVSAFENTKKSLTLSIEDGLTYQGEEGAIRNLISIFLDNALKYSLTRCEFSLKKENKAIVIECRNDAKEIGDGNQNQVFDRFYRSSSVRGSSIEGSGIGLSIAKEIADLHKARIKAYGENGDFCIKVTL